MLEIPKLSWLELCDEAFVKKRKKKPKIMSFINAKRNKTRIIIHGAGHLVIFFWSV